jgi:hypothetical protein
MADRPVVAKIGVIAVLALVLTVVLLRQTGVLALGAKPGTSGTAGQKDQTSPSLEPNARAAQSASGGVKTQ